MRPRLLSAILVAGLMTTGCNDESASPDTGPTADMPGPEAAVDLEADAGPETALDQSLDLAPDVLPDGGDGGRDLAAEGGSDLLAEGGGDLTLPDGSTSDATGPANASCSTPQVLTLSSGQVSVTSSTSSATDQFSTVDCGKGSTNTMTGPQLYYKVSLTGGQTYKATLKPASGFDAALYAFPAATTCSASAINTACASYLSENIGAGMQEALHLAPSTTEDWIFVVDSFYSTGSSSSGSFTLTVAQSSKPTHDTCTAAQALTFSSGKIAEFSDTVLATDDSNLTATDCTGNTTAGPDVFYAATMELLKVYRIRLEAMASGFNVALYLFTSCSSISTTCGTSMGADKWYSSPEEIIFAPTVTQTYYIGVDGRSNTDLGDFYLTLEEYTKATNDACSSAEVLTLTSGTATASGNTFGAASSISLSGSGTCSIKTPGPDVFYSVDLTSGSTYTVEVAGTSGYDAAVYVFTDCTTAESTCVQSVDSAGSGGTETLYFTAATTGTHIIGVDSSASGHSGSFTLTIK